MIRIEINSDKMKRASERAMTKPLRVRMIAFRTYGVLNGEGKRYTVHFRKSNGAKWAECSSAVLVQIKFRSQSIVVWIIPFPQYLVQSENFCTRTF